MSKVSKTQLIEENIENIIDLEQDIQNNSRELEKFPARLKRYSLARAQALINLNQIDSTISDLERFLRLEE